MKTFETRQIKLKLTSYCIHPPSPSAVSSGWNFETKGRNDWCVQAFPILRHP